ncbi:Camp-Dependent Protein Kinase Type Ii-Beta Regulatory Subunit [Manis pentadactyla]|nr:Camp-Dependent Protein Kinase Type Ii-Beta Regulatory Subunit [Manis pentadactyla]
MDLEEREDGGEKKRRQLYSSTPVPDTFSRKKLGAAIQRGKCECTCKDVMTFQNFAPVTKMATRLDDEAIHQAHPCFKQLTV